MPHLSEPRYPTPFVRKRQHMNSASAKNSASGSPKSDPIPIVFVVDDDISVRESLEALIRFVGWQSETFASAEGFLIRPRPVAPCCPGVYASLPELNALEA